MKKIITATLLLISLATHSQDSIRYKFKLKEHIVPAAMVFVAGMADGFNQALMYRYEGVKKVFPNINDQWYNPQISWTNKYKDHDPTKGRAFPGSRTWLVFTTDAYHATRFVSNLFNSGAIAVKIGQKKKKWYIYVIEVTSYWVVNRVAFNLLYGRF